MKDLWDRAKDWLWPRDPIILDLDGDGLETVGLASNIYFDHDGDGILTKTGWAALDSNGDGLIDANDPAFAELKLWRDADQNGLTGDGELISLAEAGIVSLNLASTLKNQSLADGNTLARQGSFTKADGSTGGMDEFKLATDTFDTQFAEAIEVPEALQSLPNMGGSGAVRELQQAAAQSDALASLLGQFQNAGTRADQADSLRRIHFVRRKDKRRRDSAKVHKTAAQGAERKRLFSSLNDDGNYSIRVRKPCAVPLHAASVALARHYSD